MPITKSAKKATHSAARKRVVNTRTKKILKTAVRSVESGAADKLSLAYKAIDKASKRGVIHRNKAARMKSRLSRKAASS